MQSQGGDWVDKLPLCEKNIQGFFEISDYAAAVIKYSQTMVGFGKADKLDILRKTQHRVMLASLDFSSHFPLEK